MPANSRWDLIRVLKGFFKIIKLNTSNVATDCFTCARPSFVLACFFFFKLNVTQLKYETF